MHARFMDFRFLSACFSPTIVSHQVPFHLVVLNTPLPTCFMKLWRAARTRICADGGANRVLEYHDWTTAEKVPDCIIGDMDSVTPKTIEYFRSKGVPISKDSDQDTNDLDKALNYLVRKIPESSSHPIVILGTTTGRFDHVMASVNALHVFHKLPLLYLSDSSVLTLVPANVECEIKWPEEWCPMTCGFAPFCGEAIVTTKGLQWNLNKAPMKFGGCISTSNVALSSTVHVTTSVPLLWSSSVPEHVVPESNTQQARL